MCTMIPLIREHSQGIETLFILAIRSCFRILCKHIREIRVFQSAHVKRRSQIRGMTILLSIFSHLHTPVD